MGTVAQHLDTRLTKCRSIGRCHHSKCQSFLHSRVQYHPRLYFPSCKSFWHCTNTRFGPLANVRSGQPVCARSCAVNVIGSILNPLGLPLRLELSPVTRLSGYRNKAVYTTAPVADGWAGAVMIWAGAVIIWAGACSNTNFPTLKMPKNEKKAKCDGPTDRPTDRPTDTVSYRSRARDKKKN